MGLCRWPLLKVISLTHNDLSQFPLSELQDAPKLLNVTTLILDNNKFPSLALLPGIVAMFPNLETLSLQNNAIVETSLPTDSKSITERLHFATIKTLNLSHNKISDYAFIDALPGIVPNLTSLRVSNNPFFTSDPECLAHASETTSLASNSASLTGPRHLNLPVSRTDAAYSLTLARIPKLQILNYSNITARDREEGEIYLLSVAERDLSGAIKALPIDAGARESTLKELKTKYPHYEELCKKYDRNSVFSSLSGESSSDTTSETSQYPSGSLGSRCIKATFFIPGPTHHSTAGTEPAQTFIRLLPPGIDVYRLKALISRTFSLPALSFALIYESPEVDPVRDTTRSQDNENWGDWGDWDLDRPPPGWRESGGGDEPTRAGAGAYSTGAGTAIVTSTEGVKWKKREVEILDGTRAWSEYLEDEVRECMIRIEKRERRGQRSVRVW